MLTKLIGFLILFILSLFLLGCTIDVPAPTVPVPAPPEEKKE